MPFCLLPYLSIEQTPGPGKNFSRGARPPRPQALPAKPKNLSSSPKTCSPVALTMRRSVRVPLSPVGIMEMLPYRERVDRPA